VKKIISILMATFLVGCASMDDKTKTQAQGAGLGAAIGAATGAIFGGGKGAAIGAAGGAAVGVLAGDQVAKSKEEQIAKEENLDNMIAEVAALNNDAQLQNNKTKAEIKAIESNVALLKEDLKKNVAKKEDLVKKRDDIQLAINNLKGQQETYKDNLNQKAQQYNSLKTQADVNQEKLDQLNKSNNELAAKITDMEQNIEELARLNKSLEEVSL
jgi:YmgG-like glycine-zipper protein